MTRNSRNCVNCVNCGAPFVPYRNGHQRYCSRQCAEANHIPGGDGIRLLNSSVERDARLAPRAQPRPLEFHVIELRGLHYRSVDANALLEESLEAENARPGHVYG